MAQRAAVGGHVIDDYEQVSTDDYKYDEPERVRERFP